MTQEQWKAGNRVRVFGISDGDAWYLQRDGEIKSGPNPNGTYNISSDGDILIAHPKQLRRLKPKRKAREFWVRFESSPAGSACTCLEPCSMREKQGCALVREVLPGRGK